MSKIPEHITPLHESLYSTILEIASTSSVINESDLDKIFPDKCDHSHTFRKEIATYGSKSTQSTDKDRDLSLTSKSKTGKSFEQPSDSLRASDTDSDSGWVVVSPSKSLMMQRRPPHLNSYLLEQKELNPPPYSALTLSEEEMLPGIKPTTDECSTYAERYLCQDIEPEAEASTKTTQSRIEERFPSRINPSMEQLPTYVGRYLWQEVDSKANSSSAEIQHLREECTLSQIKSTTKKLPAYEGRYLWQETKAGAQPLVASGENPKEKTMSQVTPRDQHLPLYVERALFQKMGLECRSTPNNIQLLREEHMSSQIKLSTQQRSINADRCLFEVTQLNPKPSTNVKLLKQENNLSQAKLKPQQLSSYAKQREEKEEQRSPQMKHISPQLSTNAGRYQFEKTEADPKSSSKEKLPEIKSETRHIPIYVEQWLFEKTKSKLKEEQRSYLIEPIKLQRPTNTDLCLFEKPEPNRKLSPTRAEILRENEKQSQLKANTQPLLKYVERCPFEKTESRPKPPLDSIQQREERRSSQIKPTTSQVFINASRSPVDITLPYRKGVQTISEPMKVKEKQSSSQNKPATLQLSTNVIRSVYERPELYGKASQTRTESLREKENLSQTKHTAQFLPLHIEQLLSETTDPERRFTHDKIDLLREEHRSFQGTPITPTSTDGYLFEKPKPTTELSIEPDRCIFEKTGPDRNSSPTTVHLMRENGNTFHTDSTRISSSTSPQKIKEDVDPSQIKLKAQQLTTYVDRVLFTGTESKRNLQASSPQSLKEQQISFQMKLTTQKMSPSSNRCAIEKSKSNQTSLTTAVQQLREEQVPSKIKLSTYVDHCLTEKQESEFDRDRSTREKQTAIQQPTRNIGQCQHEQLKLHQKPLPNNIQLMNEKQMLSKVKQLSTDAHQRLFPQTVSDRKSCHDTTRPLNEKQTLCQKQSTIQTLPLDDVRCLHKKSESNQKCMPNNLQQLMQEGSSVKSTTHWLPPEINQYLIEQGELELELYTCTGQCLLEKTKSERSDQPQTVKETQIPSQRKSVAININRRLREQTSVQMPSSNITQKMTEQQLLSTYANSNIKERAERKSEPLQHTVQLSGKEPVSSEIEQTAKRLSTQIRLPPSGSAQMAGVGELEFKKKPKLEHSPTYVEQCGWEGIQFKSNPRPQNAQPIKKEHVLHQIKPTAQQQLAYTGSQTATQPLVKEELLSKIKAKNEQLHTYIDGFIREKMELVSKDPQVTFQPIMEQRMSCQIKSTIKQPTVEEQYMCENNESVSKTLTHEASALTEENKLLHIKSMAHQLSAYVEQCLFEKKESAITSTMDKTDSMMEKQDPSQIKHTLQPQSTNVDQCILEEVESEAKPQAEKVQPVTKTQISSIFKPITQTVLTYVNRYIFKKVESETNHLLDQSQPQPLKEGQTSIIKSITQFLSTNKEVNQKLNTQTELSQNVDEAIKGLPIKYPACFDIFIDNDDELQMFRNQILDTYKRRLEEIRIYANNDINLRKITYEEQESIMGKLASSMAANTKEFEEELMELLNNAKAKTKKKAKKGGKNQNKRRCEQCRSDLEEKVQLDESNA
ncbi:uncharacterized protein LOC119688955 isoform X2 [Teleopsis dalmanni]|uniref:uncharacterized protein LOC119688955 isoform X2 n=1 Tax=Teleopsis dalmanni TaxID=139649 RepID=UPI0018CCE4D3|nr:uncharacterized protein LOC119688955 isoform X2 [Teleopsis dalmanni]